MSDPTFEHHVARLFAEPDAFDDQAAFAAAIQVRLDRGWVVRRVLIGTAGVVGGLVAAAQIVGADLVQRVSVASQSADLQVHSVAAMVLARGQAAVGAHLPPLGGEALWMVAGLAVVGVALAAVRVSDAL